MYGRCETDPFDQAVDVCDSCFGEFCAGCLVDTRGRKHPVCTECTVIASGIRPGAKPLMRGSKKTADRRRQSLRDAPRTPATFEYFDEDRGPEPGLPATGRSTPRDGTASPCDPEPGRPDPDQPGPDGSAPLADGPAPSAPAPLGIVADHRERSTLGFDGPGATGEGTGFRRPRPFVDGHDAGPTPLGDPSVAAAGSTSAPTSMVDTDHDDEQAWPPADLSDSPWGTDPDAPADTTGRPAAVQAPTPAGRPAAPLPNRRRPGGRDRHHQPQDQRLRPTAPTPTEAPPASPPAPPTSLPRRRSKLRSPDGHR